MNELQVLTLCDAEGRSYQSNLDVNGGLVDTTTFRITSGNFVAGQTYLILAHVHYQALNTGAFPVVNLYSPDSGTFIRATRSYHKLNNTTDLSRWWFGSYIVTAVAGRSLYLSLGSAGTSGNYCRFTQVGLTAIKMTGYGEQFKLNTHWGYARNNGSPNTPIDNTFANHVGASFSLTPITGHTYMIIGNGTMQEYDASVPTSKAAHMQLYDSYSGSVLKEHKVISSSQYPLYTWRALNCLHIQQFVAAPRTFSLRFAGDSVFGMDESCLTWIDLDAFAAYYTELHHDIAWGCFQTSGCRETYITQWGKPPPTTPSRTWARIELGQFTVSATGYKPYSFDLAASPSPPMISVPRSGNNWLCTPFGTDIVSHVGHGAVSPVATDSVQHQLWVYPQTASPGITPITQVQSLKWWLQLKSTTTDISSLSMYVALTTSKTTGLNLTWADTHQISTNLQGNIALVRTALTSLQASIAAVLTPTTGLEVVVAQTRSKTSNLQVFKGGSEYKTLLMRALVAITRQIDSALQVMVAATFHVQTELSIPITDAPFLVIEPDRPGSYPNVTVSDLETRVTPNSVRSASTNFEALGVSTGDVLEIKTGLNRGNYVVLSSVGHDLFLAESNLAKDAWTVEAVVRKQQNITPQLTAAVVIDQPLFNAGFCRYSLLDVLVD